MCLQGRWKLLQSTVTQWIMEDVVEGSTLGIVTFTGGSDYPGNNIVNKNLTVVTSENRKNISKAFPYSACSSDSSKFISPALSFVRDYVVMFTVALT